MAQQGFVVSVSPTVRRDAANVDAIYRICSERNYLLARRDPGNDQRIYDLYIRISVTREERAERER
jgi:hypothetical protein